MTVENAATWRLGRDLPNAILLGLGCVRRALKNLHRPQPGKQKPEHDHDDDAENREAGLQLLAECGQTSSLSEIGAGHSR